MFSLVHGLWVWRHFILSSIQQELRTRFSRSLLGGVWMLLHPLAMVLIYTLVLSAVLSAKLPGIESRFAYAIYLLSGMLGWNLFMEMIQRCLGMFIEHGNQMKKINFPHITLPFIVAGSCLVNYLVLAGIVVLVFVAIGHLSWPALWLVPLSVLTLGFSLSLGLILGTLNVFIRDLGQVMAIVLQLLFWFTPIVYPVSILPEALHGWIQLNPLFHLVQAYHQVLAFQQAPDLLPLLILTCVTGGLLLAGLFLYRKARTEMVDML